MSTMDAAFKALAAHMLLTGQVTQLGALGVHTVAPSSIIAWLKSPGRSKQKGTSEKFKEMVLNIGREGTMVCLLH